jgi:beta-phosphoglucomutase
MSYKAVLFDMDGVILDSEPLHYLATQRILNARGHALTYQQYKQHFAGKTDKEAFQKYCTLIGEQAAVSKILAEKAEAYLDVATTSQLVPCPGSIECIRLLAERQLPLALVTGSLRAEAELVLQAFGLTNAFDIVVTAEDTAHGKPHPEGYLKGAAALDVNPVDCIVIEDAPSGILAARDAGMRCLAIATTYAAEELRGASLVVDVLYAHHLASI